MEEELNAIEATICQNTAISNPLLTRPVNGIVVFTNNTERLKGDKYERFCHELQKENLNPEDVKVHKSNVTLFGYNQNHQTAIKFLNVLKKTDYCSWGWVEQTTRLGHLYVIKIV